jgi:hypothetical protein
MERKFFVRESLLLPSQHTRPPDEICFTELRDLARQQLDGEKPHDYRREDSVYWRPVSEVQKAESESDLDELVKQPFVYQRIVVGEILPEKPITEQEKARYAAEDAARAAAMQESSKSESVAIAVIAATVVIILLILLLQQWLR